MYDDDEGADAPMTWLVTGGAKYIGSHVVRAFGEVGLDVVVLDDLSSGHAGFVPVDVPLVVGSVVDTSLVEQTLAEHQVSGPVHLAGFNYAGVSMIRPVQTYEQNLEPVYNLSSGDGVSVRQIMATSAWDAHRTTVHPPPHAGEPLAPGRFS